MLDTKRVAALASALLFAQGFNAKAEASGFVEDSKGSLTLRNYYFDRDYKGESNISARREWAQGFILNLKSGFTEGPVGFGLDVQGMLGLKLDSSADRVGTGLLPTPTRRGEKAPDEYSEVGLTGKVRYSKTELNVGTVQPFLPILLSSPSRLLWQTFRGGYLRSQDLDGFSLHAGYLDRMNQRDSTDYQKLAVSAPNGRFNPAAESDRFVFAGGDYTAIPGLTLSYYQARLEDIYQQHYLGGIYQTKLGPGDFKTELRYFNSSEDGAAKAGPVDNQNIGALFVYKLGGHRLTTGGMLLSGKTATPYVAGAEVHVVSELALSSEFINPDEHNWGVRYDYDFTSLGVPGLTATARYLKGTNIDLPEKFGGSGLEESERDLEIAYVIQSGPLKNVGFRVRNALYQNNFAPNASFRDDNETRIHIDYTLKLW
ncbi:MAG TPA: OprD family porin [Pseudomonas sp.]|nr:OprD family porin [Pseudomonas sp.]